MPAYFVGDELGSLKSTKYSRNDEGWTATSNPLLEGTSTGRTRAIQKLSAFKQLDGEVLLATARADGSTSVLSISDEGAEVVSEWKETRLKDGQCFVGLSATDKGIYTCTSNGALRLTKPGEDGGESSDLGTLPMRLAQWRLSSSGETFAYAGDEVELSVWNTEQAFIAKSQPKDESSEKPKKRKRNEQLLPGEIWRAKNLPNDELNLRQPVRNTALAYLQNSSAASNQHLLVGTQFGDVRRYDTRAARRPVANWKGIGKTGGIQVIEKGISEHEAYVADGGCSLYALDLRNGKISYGYKGLSGSITTLAVSPNMLASGCQDRYVRLHSTFPPPSQVGQQQEKKGDVLDKTYAKVVPTAIVCDISADTSLAAPQNEGEVENDEDEDKLWEEMEEADSQDEDDGKHSRKSKKSKKL
ncbi:hypothetical protein C8Q75DRAFT_801608 [Abortiporus biennis]|nr:hypothetical protein C8Q75DRAFT_801608 [Abortiporus biennis]